MMKKVNIILGILFLAIASVTLSGCGEKKKNSPLTGFEQAITNADSVEVTHLVNQFFEYAENGNYDAAAGMLFKDNVDSVYNEPQPLDNKAMTDIKTVFYFKPIDYLGKWKLCMIDSHNGDRPVVEHAKKDSMQREYETETREKNLEKLKK